MALRPLVLVTATATGLLLASCADLSRGEGIPATVRIVSGDAQIGAAGAEVASPIVVEVDDAGGLPVGGQVVSFRAVLGGGAAFAGAATTDRRGRAQERWILGTTPGAQRMEVRVFDSRTGAALASASFAATAVAGPPASVSVAGGDGQVAPPGTTLPLALRAKVADAYGNAVAGVAVAFAPDEPDGACADGSATTDASGIATTSWTLGSTLGAQTLSVSVSGLSPLAFSATAKPTLAATSDVAAAGSLAGVTPFIRFLQLSGVSLADVTSVRYTIAPNAGTVSKPVDVRYTMGYLARRGYAVAGSSSLTVPVFGLYAGQVNHLSVQLSFSDQSVQVLPVNVTAAAYTDPNAVYDQPTIRQARASSSPLGFDFFYMKSFYGTPIVVDTDGQIRWIATGIPSSMASLFYDNAFTIGAGDMPKLSRLDLDGTLTQAFVLAPSYSDFHHNIDVGKRGLLIEVDTADGAGRHIESTLAEVTPAGYVLKEWNMETLIAAYMQSQGDDPSAFVRPGVDWFHMNSATYDSRDDSILVSSRENFVIKLDYATGDVIWILGDPTKYWSTFPSLVSKSLALAAGGLYPIGQHAVSIAPSGLLLLFNNGFASRNQPTGQPAGESRTYSAVSAYSIDAAAGTAREEWRFDYGQSILSRICSSAFEASDHSVLVSYASAENMTRARLVALDAAHDVVFDFEYVSTSPCAASWYALPIPFEALTFR